MPTASTVASIIIALAVIAVVVRWPRLPADRRVLERRAHGLEALATVVARSAESRNTPAPEPPSAGIAAAQRRRRGRRTTGGAGPAEHPEDESSSPRTAEVGHTDAVTLLGPVGITRGPQVEGPDANGTTPNGGEPSPAPGVHPTARPARHRSPRSTRTAPPRPAGSPGRATPLPPHPPGPAEATRPAAILRLDAADVPPDDDLAETTDALDAWPTDGTPPPLGSTGAWRGRAAAPPAGGQVSPATTAAAIPGATPAAAALARPSPLTRGALRHRRARVVLAAVVAVVVGGSLAAGVRNGTAPSDTSSGDAAVAVAPPSPPTTDPSPPPTLTPTATNGELVAFAAATPLTLDLAAGAPSWIRVQTTAGVVLFEGTLAAGEQTSVRAEEAVLIRLGNPAGILAAADGGLLDHPRTPGQPLTLALG